MLGVGSIANNVYRATTRTMVPAIERFIEKMKFEYGARVFLFVGYTHPDHGVMKAE